MHPGHYRVLFYTRRRPPTKTARLPSNLSELEWGDSGLEAFGDLVRGVERCLPPGRDPLPVALMVWAGEHGYVGLRETWGGHFPFPDPPTYITRLLDAHLAE